MKPELLAPAGSLEKLKIAFAFGADAVYCGIPDFSLRVRINTFTFKKLEQGINYAHQQGRKVYLTLNIYAHNQHLKHLPKYIKFIKKAKPDGLIVSDPGIISILKKQLPKIPLHLSTQANCTNWQAAKFWHEQGIKRIILGREVTLKEIKEIHQRVPKLELEYFVHGAMCMSYSGRCLLSKWLTGRSANLGDCAQPCRWKYYLTEEQRPGELIPIEQNQHGTYILNSKDLCLIKYLDKLKQAGICSFKIEGRAKSAYYIAIVTKVYRQAIDKTKPISQSIKELDKVTNREYTTGFLFGQDKFIQKTDASHAPATYQFVGEVVKYNKDKQLAIVKVHNAIYLKDQLEFVVPQGDNFSQKLTQMWDLKTNEEIKKAHGGQGQTVLIKTQQEAPQYTVIRRKLK